MKSAFKKSLAVFSLAAAFALGCNRDQDQDRGFTVIEAEEGVALSQLESGMHKVKFGQEECIVIKGTGAQTGFTVNLGCKADNSGEKSSQMLLKGNFLAEELESGKVSTVTIQGNLFDDNQERTCRISADVGAATGYAVSLGCTPSVY